MTTRLLAQSELDKEGTMVNISQKIKLLALVILATCIQNGYAKTDLTDSQIKQQIIQQSIASYPGNCPCPYSTARNGSTCGARSAYSKPGGYDPICYPNDVTQSMIEQYRRSH